MTNDLTHITDFEYDPKWGVITETEDPNGNVTELDHDVHGRLAKVALPGDSLGSPTVAYSYTIPGTSPAKTTTTSKTAGGNVTTATYVDGFGRVIQTQTPSPENNGSRTMVTTRYDSSGFSATTWSTTNLLKGTRTI